MSPRSILITMVTQLAFVRIATDRRVFTCPLSPGDHPQAPDQLGEFQALDLRTGEASWRPRLRVPYNTAALTTGGGLVFIGDWGRRVHAYDR